MNLVKTILISMLILIVYGCNNKTEKKSQFNNLCILSKSTTLTIVKSNKIPFNKPLPYIIDSCNINDNNWRLPTVEELNKLYLMQKKGLKKFGENVFLSDDIGAHDASVIDFKNGKWGYHSQYDEVFLLLVKDTIVAD